MAPMPANGSAAPGAIMAAGDTGATGGGVCSAAAASREPGEDISDGVFESYDARSVGGGGGGVRCCTGGGAPAPATAATTPLAASAM